jgi:hypothetical protein
MANALKFGLDVSKWPKAQKNAFERSMEEWKLNYYAPSQHIVS